MAWLPAIRSTKPSSPFAEALMRTSSPARASILSAFLTRDFQTLGAHRLDHEVDGAGAHCCQGDVATALGCLHNDRRLARQGPHCLKHGHAVGAWHNEVEQTRQMSPAASL
jgi:hypothetical protein